MGMELSTIELIDRFLIIIVHCLTLKMLTLRIKVFLALTELLLGNLVFCRHSFLCLIIRFLLSQPLFNQSDPIIHIMLLFVHLINFKTSTSCIYINGRTGDYFFLLVLLARIPSMLHYFKLFYFWVSLSMCKLSCSWRHKLFSNVGAPPTFLDFFSYLL